MEVVHAFFIVGFEMRFWLSYDVTDQQVMGCVHISRALYSYKLYIYIYLVSVLLVTEH